MTIGEKIKSRRIELNMSQEELAKKCGYKSRSSINKIELSRDLPLKKVKVMANALDISVAYLMGWEENSNDFTTSLEDILDENPGGTFKYLYEGIKHKNIVDNISDEECDLINTYRTLDDEHKRMIVEMIAFYKSKKQDD